MRAKLVDTSGRIKEVKVGYSWTTLFLGFIVPVSRGDSKNAFIQLGISTVASMLNVIIPAIPTLLYIAYNAIYFASHYNKMYTAVLLQKGYAPASEIDAKLLRSSGYIQ